MAGKRPRIAFFRGFVSHDRDYCCILPNRLSYPEVTGGYTDTLYDSPEDLFCKMDFFLRDGEARTRASERLHEMSLRYTPENVVPRIQQLIEEAMAEKRC